MVCFINILWRRVFVYREFLACQVRMKVHGGKLIVCQNKCEIEYFPRQFDILKIDANDAAHNHIAFNYTSNIRARTHLTCRTKSAINYIVRWWSLIDCTAFLRIYLVRIIVATRFARYHFQSLHRKKRKFNNSVLFIHKILLYKTKKHPRTRFIRWYWS